MEQLLRELPHECEYESLLFEHGTHFVFPQSMLKLMLPVVSGLLPWVAFRAARQHPKECRQTRLIIDQKLAQAICSW